MTQIKLPPWQIFSLIFTVFYLIIRRFDSILITLIFSVLYGVIMDVMSKYLYVWSNEINEKTNFFNGNLDSVAVDEEDTDEELDEKYANLEVDFDESETEEDECVSPRLLSGRVCHEDFNEEEEGDFPDEFLLYETREYDSPVAASRGKSFIQDDIHCAHGIDLNDPTVKAAATKIQSVFKGFKTRKRMFQDGGFKLG